MANYGIFRVEKLKKISNLRGSLLHAFREQETPNADPNRRNENILLTRNTFNVATTLEKYEELKPKGKIRNDVVHAIEVLVTASPEKMAQMTKEEQIDYLKKSLNFCNSEFGKGNLLHAQIHYDETTAHLTAFYIPVIEKENKKGEVVRKLNASSILGGKSDYSERQTRFYEQVSKHYGLVRGEIGSKASHKKVLDWYSEINAERCAVNVNAIIDELNKKPLKEVSVDIEKPESGFFSFLGGKTKVERENVSVKGLVTVNEISDVLSPFTNNNSEMRRREKQAIKKEVRKELRAEVEAELLDKFKEREAFLNRREMELQELIAESEAKEAKAINTFYKVGNIIGIDLSNSKDFFNDVCKRANELLSVEKQFGDTNAKVRDLTASNVQLRGVNKGYQDKILDLEHKVDDLVDENTRLASEINLLREPKNFETLREEYRCALKEKATPILNNINSCLDGVGAKKYLYNQEVDMFNKAQFLLSQLMGLDENYGLVQTSKLKDKFEKASVSLVNDRYRGNKMGMGMGL